NGSRPLGIITPNQQISFNVADNKVIKQDVDAQQVISWQQSEMHFDDISFGDAAKQLEQRFKVQINFSNEKLKNCRFTGTALAGEKLDAILKVICTFNNAAYQTKTD